MIYVYQFKMYLDYYLILCRACKTLWPEKIDQFEIYIGYFCNRCVTFQRENIQKKEVGVNKGSNRSFTCKIGKKHYGSRNP